MAQNDLQWQILSKKWLRLAANDQFWSFCCFSIFSPKMRLRLTWNGQFHLIHNFSHLLPPMHLILREISKIFIPGGGVHWQIFWVFQLFWIISHWSSSKWSTKANFATEVVWISSKCVILVKCQQKLKYLSRILTDLHQTFRRGLVSPNWSKWVQGVVCYNQNWWKLKYLSRISIDLHQQFFFEFFNYFESFHTKASQNDLQW